MPGSATWNIGLNIQAMEASLASFCVGGGIVLLRIASRIGRVLWSISLNNINRLFGIILAAIAVEIMANGFKALFPALAG